MSFYDASVLHASNASRTNNFLVVSFETESAKCCLATLGLEDTRVNVNGPFNPKNLFEEDPPERTPDVHDEIASVRELLNKTRSELSHTRRRIERRELEFDKRMRFNRIVLVTTLLSCVGLAAVLWYRVPLLRTFETALTGSLPVISKHPAAVEAQPDSTGGKLNSMSQEHEKMSQPAQALPESNAVQDSGLHSNVADADKLRATIPTVRDVHSRLEEAPSGSQQLRLLSDNVNRDRVDFEITRNRTDEVAPGIYLTIQSTDVEQQRIVGWLQIAEDGRTVWIREQSAQKVIVFATRRDARNRELVFTRIDKSGAAGYLLIPTGNAG